MDVSIGIMAYNEEKNIGKQLKFLLNQKTKTVKIKEIIVVSSGSTDSTNSIVRDFSKNHRKIKLIIQKKREGKASAINEFLKAAKNRILVLESGDTIPEKDAIEKLCLPLKNNDVGIVASRPIPKNNNGFLSPVIALQWELHHKISMSNPKFGEMIAFKKLFDKIDDTASDDEFIAMVIKNKRLKGVYVPDSIVYNSGPKTIADFLKQRRRCYWGCIELKKKNNYETSTINNLNVFKFLLREVRPKNIFIVVFAAMLEGSGRLLGAYDFYTNRNHYVWDIAGKK